MSANLGSSGTPANQDSKWRRKQPSYSHSTAAVQAEFHHTYRALGEGVDILSSSEATDANKSDARSALETK